MYLLLTELIGLVLAFIVNCISKLNKQLVNHLLLIASVN